MKKLILSAFTFLVSATLVAQGLYISELDYKTKQKNYDTFKFMDMESAEKSKSLEAVVVEKNKYATFVTEIWSKPYPSKKTYQTIRHSIMHELISQDYNMTKGKPDFYVIFGVFSDDGTIMGDFDYDNEMVLEKKKIKKGTIMISMIDVETNQAVWTGYSDNALNGNYEVEEQVAVEHVTNLLQRLGDFKY